MQKIGKCGLVVCAVGAVVLVISGCNDANGVFKGEEKRLVEASLGGSERSVRGKRSVASESIVPAYYESAFRVKMKTGGEEKCLALREGEREPKFVECTEGYDARQVWYFDYNGYIFSRSGGRKACLYQDKDGILNSRKIHWRQVLIADSRSCNKSNFWQNNYLFKVRLEQDKEGHLYFTTTRAYDERGAKVIVTKFSDIRTGRAFDTREEVKKEYQGYVGFGSDGQLVFVDRKSSKKIVVSLEDAQRLVVYENEKNIEEVEHEEGLYTMYAGKRDIFINPNRFWDLEGASIPQKMKWKLQTHYVPSEVSSERDAVRMVLPFYVEKIIKGNVDAKHKIEVQKLYEMKIEGVDEGATIGVVKVVYSNGKWEKGAFVFAKKKTVEVRYEFNGQVVASRRIELEGRELKKFPVLLLFVDLRKKRMMAHIGTWGASFISEAEALISMHFNRDEMEFVDISLLGEDVLRSFSRGITIGGNGQRKIEFVSPVIERNVSGEMSVYGFDEGAEEVEEYVEGAVVRKRRVKRGLLTKATKLVRRLQGWRSVSSSSLRRRIMNKVSYKAKGSEVKIWRGSSESLVKESFNISAKKKFFKVLKRHWKKLAIGGGVTAISLPVMVRLPKWLQDGEGKSEVNLKEGENAKFLYRIGGEENEEWKKICAIEKGDTTCMVPEVGVKGAYKGKSLTYEYTEDTKKDDNTKADRVKKGFSLACFRNNEKFSVQVYNHLCITDEEPSKVHTTVKSGDGATKQKIQGNAIYLWVDEGNSLDDVTLHVSRVEGHKSSIATNEYLLMARFSSLLGRDDEAMITIEDTRNDYAVVRQRSDKKTISFHPPSVKAEYKDKVWVDGQGRLVYQGVSLSGAPGVPGGSIYRYAVQVLEKGAKEGAKKKSKKGTFRATDSRILRGPATSDGITNESTQLYPRSYDFGKGTGYWKGSGSNDYIETRKTPKNYVDVWFEDKAKVSFVEFKTSMDGKTIVLRQPVGVVSVVLKCNTSNLI